MRKGDDKMSIVDTLLTRAQELRNNVLTQSVSLQSVASGLTSGGILSKFTGSSGLASGLTSGGILSKVTGSSGVLSQRTKFLQSRITAMNSQSTPVDKVKALLNPETPSFVPKLMPSGGILSSLSVSTPSYTAPASLLPATTPTVTPVAKQIIELPPATTATVPIKTSTVLFA